MQPAVQPEFIPQVHSKPSLADLLTIENSVSIFYSYARETDLSRLLSEEANNGQGWTLFAPTNKAVMTLPRKPHQGSERTNEVEMTQEEFDRTAKTNVERWVSAHIIAEYPLTFDTEDHSTLLEGSNISFKRDPNSDAGSPEWKQFTLNNGARIVSKKEGINGDLYIIDGSILID
ncbi:hypothetical protein CPB83DRAFT_767291 [Crepidotus variabilis]|uniref:FAS1 domain-containing protein n=1 Tax=Crepidotus variabilis TaxID=179855 RepID=A0A9P6EFW0_9AGAR|nr:hypothetical protein CPB83DRAFT_767291 [Crepidotus variabilis]